MHETDGRYREMAEAELLEAARSYADLNDGAQAAMRAEFARRGIEAPLVEDGDEMEARRLVTVARYRDLSEAIVARTMLESAGIGVYLRDENLVRLDWQISNFIGGLRLQVDENGRGAGAGAAGGAGGGHGLARGWGGICAAAMPGVRVGGDYVRGGVAGGGADLTLRRGAAAAGWAKETWRCETCGVALGR